MAKRKYLKQGDEIYVDGANAIIDENNYIKQVSWHSDCNFFHNGLEVEWDDDGNLYVEYEETE